MHGPMWQQISCSMSALCVDRRKQDVAPLGSAWPHGATDHPRHACLVQIQGKRVSKGGDVGNTGFGIEEKTDQKVC